MKDEPEFYFPAYWRKAAENVKQGSSDEEVKILYYHEPFNPGVFIDEAVREYTADTVRLYNDMLNVGVCAEQARMILPQNTMTEWIWSGSLYAFARVCNLRLDSHTQRETQEVAKQISHFARRAFPESWKVLVNEDSSTSSK